MPLGAMMSTPAAAIDTRAAARALPLEHARDGRGRRAGRDGEALGRAAHDDKLAGATLEQHVHAEAVAEGSGRAAAHEAAEAEAHVLVRRLVAL